MTEPNGGRLRQSLRLPMPARSRDEEHRGATPLELFFDLCFVVAVAQGILTASRSFWARGASVS